MPKEEEKSSQGPSLCILLQMSEYRGIWAKKIRESVSMAESGNRCLKIWISMKIKPANQIIEITML